MLKPTFFTIVVASSAMLFFLFLAILPVHLLGNSMAEAHTPMIAPLETDMDEVADEVEANAADSLATPATMNQSTAPARDDKSAAETGAQEKMLIAAKPKVCGVRIARSAKRVAKSMRSKGLCYRGVKRALKPFGVELTGSSAYMAKSDLKEDPRFKVVAVNKFNNLKPGDILVHGKSKAHKHGHIAVYLGDNKEASDHVQELVTSRRYGTTVVFRMTGT